MLIRNKFNGFKFDGSRQLHFGGGGGGGGGSPPPSSQTVSNTSIPEYARPYVERMLGKSEALTDINQNPYQPYGGERIAGFSDLQKEAFARAAAQTPAEQIGAGSQLAQAAGMGALGAQPQAAMLGQEALGYGAAGARYGDIGAQQALARAAQAQRQAQMYGGMGAGFGGQAAGLAPTAQEYGARAAEVGMGGLGYGRMGAGFGAQAAGLSPVAQAYGQEAADIGLGGLGLGALGTGYGARGALAAEQGFGAGEQYARMATDPYAMRSYMSPYMQEAVDRQKFEATRDYEKQLQAQKAQAVGVGAFGGSRQAIAQAEAQRNLNQQLQNIQAAGTQRAFEQAQQAQQFGAGLGLQGLQAGYQGLGMGLQGAGVGLSGLGTALQGQQARMAGLGQAGQFLGQGMQGAQVGMAGISPALQGLQGAQAGLGQAGQLYGLGMQGAGLGLQGVGQQLGAGQLGLAGTGQGISGAQAGMQGVQGALGAGQYGLQGLGAATAAAGTLGQLGQTQFGQEQAISAEQQKIGAIQQAQAQQALDLAYQDFLKQRNYPYQQLGFMSDMLRGLPLSQTAQTMYTAPPSLGSQLGGLGMAGLGIYGMSGGFRAKGGVIKEKKMAKGGYASGGDIKMLSTKQLEQMLDNPNLTPMEVEMIEKQLMLRRRMEMNPESDRIMQQSGITSIPTGNMVPMEELAGGGIVAFAAGSKDAVQEDPVSNKEYREFLRSNIMERLKNLESGPDPFAESKKAEAETRAQLAERRKTAPYEALAMAGLGTLAGTSQYGLTNLGLGSLEGMKTYGRAKAEEGQLEKALMQQGIEREKAKYGRDVQNLNALQTSLGQMDAREIAAMNQKSAQSIAAANRADTLFQQTANAYQDKLIKARESLRKGDPFSDKYKTDEDLDKAATDFVNKSLTARQKKILFGDESGAQAPAVVPAPAPAPAPAAVKTPPPAAVKMLKNQDTPERREQFDAIFGPGAARRALGK